MGILDSILKGAAEGLKEYKESPAETIRRMQAEQEEHRKQISRSYEHKNDILVSDFLRSHQNTK